MVLKFDVLENRAEIPGKYCGAGEGWKRSVKSIV